MIDIQVIKAKLEEQTCPEHGQHPTLNVLPEGMSIAACCQPFHDKLNTMLEAEVEAAISKAFEQAMKGMES